ncbi:MAG: hypothetical protein II204_05320 [Alistipes sp.]|nr:hypothetical protein [Alistipes sp.]
MKRLLTLLLVVGVSFSAMADEGMWLLPYIKKMNEKDMKAHGAKLKAEYGDKFYIVSPEYLYLPLAAYLTDAGIVFQYNSNEIADMELGNIAVELTDAELEAVGAPLVWK